MAWFNLFIFLVSLVLMIKSAEFATRSSSRLARIFHLSEFTISFFVVALISVVPETMVSLISAFQGAPEFGLGVLIGSNITDLTLVFGIVAIFSRKGLHVKSEILKEDLFYLVLLLLPVLLGFDGKFSRIDGLVLIFCGLLFFFTLSRETKMFRHHVKHAPEPSPARPFWMLALSLFALLFSAAYTVKYGIAFSNDIGMPPLLISLTILSIGTCLPELVFSLKAVKEHHDGLVLGDVLGTVITDATIILGIVAVIFPFSFEMPLLYITCMGMFLAGILTMYFITTGKILAKREGVILILFYLVYLIAEFTLRGYVLA